MTPAQLKALQDYQDAVNGYKTNGLKETSVQGHLTPEQLGASAMGDVHADSGLKADELEALKQLEAQSREGLTDRDRASIAQAEQSANRANRGRIGAIQQNMQARGLSGSGMDLVAQMGSSQDANELEAMKALETAGMAADRRSQGTRDLANQSRGMANDDWNQQAQKAQAADAISRFNNQLSNNAAAGNLQNAQNVANANTQSYNDFQHNVLGASTGAAQTNYNAATEEENRRILAEQERARQKAQKNHATGAMIGTGIGAVAGGMMGGPAGAYVGANAGSQLGGGIADAAYWRGGEVTVPGHAKVAGDSPENDTVIARLSPGEHVQSREDVAKNDAIGDMLMAVGKLHKTTKGKR